MSTKQGLASIGQGRSDMFRIDPRVIRVKEGWNCRDLTAQDTQEHIASLSQSIAEIGVQEPLTVYWEEGAAWLSDGHCRLKATMVAIEGGADIKTVPVKSEQRYANDADRLFSQVIRNAGKPFSALENAKVYAKLIGYGWTQGDIAKKAGISAGRVSQILELLALPEAVKQMVSNGQVSAHLAATTVAEHNGSKALQLLQDAVVVAQQNGKARATKRDVAGPKKPSTISVVKDAFESAYYDEGKDTMIVTFKSKKFELLRQALGL